MPSQQQPSGKPAWRAFWSLLCIQSINSLNEKGVQFILIALGIWLGRMLQYPLSVLIVVPFVLFSPVAGWISDRYCKTKLLRSMVLLQVVALVGIVAVWQPLCCSSPSFACRRCFSAPQKRVW